MEQPRPRWPLLAALIGAAVLVGWAGSAVVRRSQDSAGAAVVRRVVPADRRVIVEVLNGSGQRGMARTATRVLRRAGFDVIYFGNAAEASDTSQVLVRRGSAEPGAWMRRALGVGVVREATDTLRRVDLTVIIGADWRPPPSIIP